MDRVCIVIRKAPYGTLAAAEGVRHLIEAAGMEVAAVLVDDGVYVGKHGHDPSDTEWTGLSTVLQQALGPDACTGSRRISAYGTTRR